MLELLQHGLRFAWIGWEREWTTKPVQNSLTSGLSGDENSLTIYFTTGLWAWQLVMVYICFHWPLCTTVNDDAFSVTTASEGSSIKDVHKNTVKNLPLPLSAFVHIGPYPSPPWTSANVTKYAVNWDSWTSSNYQMSSSDCCWHWQDTVLAAGCQQMLSI